MQFSCSVLESHVQNRLHNALYNICEKLQSEQKDIVAKKILKLYEKFNITIHNLHKS